MLVRLLFAAFCTLAATGATAQSIAGHSFTDARRGFSIAYPEGWRVDPGYKDKGYAFFQGETDDVRDGVAFRPGSDLAPGSNLESDQLALVVQRARPGDLCVAAAFLTDQSPDVPVQDLVRKPDVVHILALPGDRYGVEQVVLIASHAPCLAVHYFIYFSRPAPGDPATKPDFDRKALFALLNAIADTLKPVK